MNRAYSEDLQIGPKSGKYKLLRSAKAIAASNVLYVGVAPLYEFGYSDIRLFSKNALAILRSELPTAKHIAMTMHGVGYGLDERESFLAQIGGILDAQDEGIHFDQVSIVEIDSRRAGRLRLMLSQALPEPVVGFTMFTPGLSGLTTPSLYQEPSAITAGTSSQKKQHIFVAMPFSKDLEDVYVFGIQGPTNDAGYLCERVDMLSFTGDILTRIKSRIETSSLVIADLTGANPNVYLEVGYAWGKSRPTLLLAKSSEELKFDVKGQRCLIYDSIVDLSRKMKNELSSLTDFSQ